MFRKRPVQTIICYTNVFFDGRYKNRVDYMPVMIETIFKSQPDVSPIKRNLMIKTVLKIRHLKKSNFIVI